MKKIFLILSIILLNIFSVNAEKMIDTSIIDELENQEVKEVNIDFKLKTFESCENLENVMEKYIKDYYKNNQSRYNRRYDYEIMEGSIDFAMEEATTSVESDSSEMKNKKSIVLQKTGGGGSDDFAKTNSQVDGVDESDIIKTDGKYVYYYNATKKQVYIIEAYGTDNVKILKQIALPKSFNNPVLYIGNNKLVIISSGYSDTQYSKNYYINRNNKTYTVVFDIENKEKPKLEKLYVNDGNFIKSRKIGNLLYVISNNNFNIPYHSFESIDDIDVNISDIIPKKFELSKTSNKDEQNFKLRGKETDFNIKAGNIAKCSEIEYSLPNEETLKKIDFNPSYNIISIIDIENSEKEVKTKVIAGSNSEIYMSLDNLYLTEGIYQNQTFKCSANSRCISPYYWGGSRNTIVHKINIERDNLSYQTSTLIPGAPLTQYSMDEKDSNFRIITSTNTWGEKREKHTDLYILDKNLKLVSNLSNLGEGENFKSSRFMGDKLFLVTFQNIDPFYVIDLKDQKNPKILGELKIPGYSTYLHPYDENHIIGVGYDTVDNGHGGVYNGGIKLDLYQINYDKKCGDINLSEEEKTKCDSGDYKGIIVKQKYTKTIGDSGSYSEAQHNPRMFMWNTDKKLLFLPSTIYTKFEGEKYRNKDFFQGLVTFNIDKNSGIKEEYRITHIDYSNIEDERIKECSKYSAKEVEKTECKKLIDGSTYCPPVRQIYVPKYCYADSTVGEYIASKNWNYKDSFVKRGLWIGNKVYSISDDKIVKSDIFTGKKEGSIEMK